MQGIGLGLVFVPLSTATFATLEPAMCPQGTALFSLVRNLGSSIGISAVQALLVHNTTVAHASLAASLNETGLAAQATGGAATGLAPPRAWRRSACSMPRCSSRPS